MYKDYQSLNGNWYTFRPLPIFQREELSKRFNTFNKYKKISIQIVNNPLLEYNLKKILDLYDLNLDDFEVNELDDLILNNIIKVNFSVIEYKKPDLNKKQPAKPVALDQEEEDNSISKLFSSIWGICDNAGDALYMMEKIPAEILLSTIKAEELERIYSTDKDKKKKEQKSIKEQLLKKVNKSYES